LGLTILVGPAQLPWWHQPISMSSSISKRRSRVVFLLADIARATSTDNETFSSTIFLYDLMIENPGITKYPSLSA
jgi:hypothetical protein